MKRKAWLPSCWCSQRQEKLLSEGKEGTDQSSAACLSAQSSQVCNSAQKPWRQNTTFPCNYGLVHKNILSHGRSGTVTHISDIHSQVLQYRPMWQGLLRVGVGEEEEEQCHHWFGVKGHDGGRRRMSAGAHNKWSLPLKHTQEENKKYNWTKDTYEKIPFPTQPWIYNIEDYSVTWVMRKNLLTL